MTTTQYDREALQLFGLTVTFVSPDKRWCVTGNGVGELVCGDFAAAVDAREAIVLRYLPKMDQITIDSSLRTDRIAMVRSEIIDLTCDGIDRHDGHVPSLYVFESGGFWGEAYDDELLALERLLESAKAEPVNFLAALRSTDGVDVVSHSIAAE